MDTRTAPALALAAASLVALSACTKLAPPPAAAPAPAPAVEPAPVKQEASSETLAWMAGNWCGKDGDQSIEESWFAPHANEMIGMSRTLAGGRMISFEYMRIMDLEGTITLIAQPGGAPPTNFKRTDGDRDWIRFENKQHDYPQRIEYRKAGEGLHAEIAGPGEPGKEAVISYEYQRLRQVVAATSRSQTDQRRA
jgi:hypothetical protein